jgi:hypothetical protein
MREFLPDISREICMFFLIPKKISRHIVKSGRSIIILLQELKSKAREGKADTRSGRLRSTFPGTGTGARRRETVTIYLVSLACNFGHDIGLYVCSWPCLLLTSSNIRCRLQFFLNITNLNIPCLLNIFRYP